MSVNPWRSEKVRLTREQVQPIADELEYAIRMLNPDLEFYFGGSWRRGRATVGDLDVLFVTEAGTMHNVRLPASVLIQRSGSQMTQGDFEAQGITVHVDFWSASPAERGAFLWFITGPKELNIAMRVGASKRGWILNQKGLFLAGMKLDNGTEEDVARLLGPEWLELLDPLKRESWAPPSGEPNSTLVRSSAGDKFYEVLSLGDNYECSCPSFKYRGRCKHIDGVREEHRKVSDDR